MAHPKTLTEVQANVLEWIGNGCPPGVYEGVAHRISAAALARRGLVRVAGRGPQWSATITGDGKTYLERMTSPQPPTPRQPNVSVTQQLVDDVVASGGTARFPRPVYWKKDQVDYERRAALAHRFGKVPDGKQLVVTRVDDELEISLVDAAHDAPNEPAAVPVPERVARFHPLVAAFRSDRTRHEVSRAELSRACRILHVLITEAERRGHGVRAAVPGSVNYGQSRWSGPSDGHFVVSTDEYAATLRIHEEGLGSRSYWEGENQRKVPTSTGYYVARNRPVSDSRRTRLVGSRSSCWATAATPGRVDGLIGARGDLATRWGRSSGRSKCAPPKPVPHAKGPNAKQRSVSCDGKQRCAKRSST